MRRTFVLLLLVGAVAVLTVTSSPAHVRAGPAATAAVWSAPRVLVPPTQYAFDPRLAVSERGAALAAWYGGPEPLPAQAGVHVRRSSVAAPGPVWAGSSVVIDTGTLAGGFAQPVTLADHGAAVSDGLDVAISGAGVRYVAWQKYGGGWMVATAARGRGFVSRALPVPLDQLLASPAGPVAAVWHVGAAGLRYAVLTTGGGLGHVVRVPGRFARGHEPLALNDHGAFAVVENTAEDGAARAQPPHPIVSLCESSGHCLAPHPLRMGHPPAGSEENDALSLSNDGTLAVLAAFSKTPRNPAPNTPWGLWDSTRTAGGHWSVPQEISDGGELPLAASDGHRSAVTVFQHFWTPKLHWLHDRIEISALHGPGGAFSTPDLVRGEEAPDPAALAATSNAGLLVAWINRGDIAGGEHSEPGLYALAGSANSPGAPQLVTGAPTSDETPAVGIDRARQGMVLWSGSTEKPYRDAGVYASFSGVS